MRNEELTVESSKEPKVSTRFGFGEKSHMASPKTIRLCAGLTICGIVAALLLRAPEPVTARAEISAPEMQGPQEKVDLTSYSISKDQTQVEGKKNSAKGTVRLPGLQKIERKNSRKIPPGSLVKAILVTGASNGPARVETVESLRIQGETLIPEGTTLLGVGSSTEDRLMLRFSQMVFRDGSFESISAQAADPQDKTVGLRGSRVGRAATKYAAAIGLNFVGGMAEGLQDREFVGQQVVTKPNAKNALLNGTSRATLEMANEAMNDLKNNAPVIQIDAGKEILIIFDVTQ